MNVLDLFSGIGGFSLGLERAGMRTVAFCEIDARCRAVLAKHWPGIPSFADVSDLSANHLAERIDVIAGGFPCQDISSAADAPAGIEGLRSGLWREFARLIGELRPKFAIVENVSALRQRGLDVVLGDLASLGYDAEWHCIPASAVGAPHPRDRIWIVAYTPEVFRQGQRRDQPRRILSRDGLLGLLDNEGRGEPVPSWWAAEPSVDRVVHGISERVDRLGELSNSVVPQIPEIIGRAIMKVANEHLRKVAPCVDSIMDHRLEVILFVAGGRIRLGHDRDEVAAEAAASAALSFASFPGCSEVVARVLKAVTEMPRRYGWEDTPTPAILGEQG